jgi:hypothetical protein
MRSSRYELTNTLTNEAPIYSGFFLSGNRGRGFGFGKAVYTHIRYTQTQTQEIPQPRPDSSKTRTKIVVDNLYPFAILKLH